MPLPSMPSLSDLPMEELRKFHVANQIFEDTFGTIHNPDGDGNSGYYALFRAFKFLGKILHKRKHLVELQPQKQLKQGERSCSSFD